MEEAKHSPQKFSNFTNKLTKKELEEFEKNIEEGCGLVPKPSSQSTTMIPLKSKPKA